MRSLKICIAASFFLLICAASGYSQNEITGYVMTEDGTPLYGAKIAAKGTNFTAITGKNGKFKFIAPKLKLDLKISSKKCKSYSTSLDMKRGEPTDLGEIKLKCKEGAAAIDQ